MSMCPPRLRRRRAALPTRPVPAKPLERRVLLSAQMVADILPGPDGSQPYQFTDFGDKLVFATAGSTDNRGLWVTDGTADGTTKVLAESIRHDAYDGRRAPAAAEALESRRLLSIEPVANFWPNREFDPRDLQTFGDKVYFSGKVFEQGAGAQTRAFVTEGPGQTVQLAGDSSGHHSFSGRVALGDRLLFKGYAGTGGKVYSTDGTPEGTTRLGVINTPDNVFNDVPWGGRAGDRVAFVGYATESNQGQLYVTDGTDGGTASLAAALPAPHAGTLAVVGSNGALAWFVDTTALGIRRLGVTDGTAAGTRILADLNTGAQLPLPVHFRTVGPQVFFQVPTAQGLKLWKSDGTPQGTGPLNTPLVVIEGPMGELGGRLYFFGAPDARSPATLYRTTGTTIEPVFDAKLGGIYGARSTLYRAGDYLWWQNGEDWRRGDGLGGIWRTDGTAAGTAQVARTVVANHFTHAGDRLWLVGISGLIDLDDPTQFRHTGLPAFAYNPLYRPPFSVAELDGYVYFPHEDHGLYRAPVPDRYLANVRISLFNDADSDGVRDAGERGYNVPGITGVYADLDNDGARNGNEPYATLNADGTGHFTGLRDGQTVFRVVDGGARVTTPQAVTVTVVNGQDPAPLEFGLNRNNRVSGVVYDDQNANHARESSEPPLAGRRVYLDLDDDSAFDEGEPSASTDAAGVYRFEHLGTGGKRLRVEAPQGWRNTENGAGILHEVYPYALERTYGPFGQTTHPPTREVRVDLFLDYDGDGVHSMADGAAGPGGIPSWHEPPLPVPPQAPAFLDADDDGVHDEGEPRSPAGSRIQFPFVVAGRYTLRFEAPAGWVPSTPGTVIDVPEGNATAPISVTTGVKPGGAVGSVTGTVFEDDDFDGVRDDGEVGFASRPLGSRAADLPVVFVDANRNGFRDPLEPTTYPDALGNFGFPGLPAGTYRVGITVATPPPSYELTPASPATRLVTFDGTNPVAGVNFGLAEYTRQAAASGRVYRDVNANGAFDDGVDVPLPNVVVTSDWLAQFPGGSRAALTGPDGRYVLPTAPLSQRVSVAAPPGWSASSPTPVQVAAQPFRVTTGTDFRLAPAGGAADAPLPAGITGHRFHDFDADGARDDADPRAFVLSSFYPPQPQPYLDLNRSGFRNAGEPAATPDDRGRFYFANLPAGSYDLRLDATGGYFQTLPADRTAYALALQPGQRADGPLFGAAFGAARAAGEVFLDADGSGTRDPGEASAAGVRVAVDLNGNGIFGDAGDRTTLTSATGAFTFATLSPGRYAFGVADDPKYAQTAPAGGLFVDLARGANVTGLVLGARRTSGALGGAVYFDANRNGQRDPDERNFNPPAVTVEDVSDPSRKWTAQGTADGRWSLDPVAPGTYRVRAQANPNTLFTAPAAPHEWTVTVAAGQVLGNLDFGWRYRPVTVRGGAFHDLDQDGNWDQGEPGLPGVTFRIRHNVDAPMAGPSQATTGADGRYEFNDLDPAIFDVTADKPPRMLATFPWGGTVRVINTTPGAAAEAPAFGFFAPTSDYISGTVYRDANANGRRDPGEPPLVGRVIHLDDSLDGTFHPSEPHGVSDADGWYAIARYDRRDRYPLRQLLPSGEVGTSPPGAGWQFVSFPPGGSADNVDFGSIRWPEPGRAAVFGRHVAYDAGAAGAAAGAAAAASGAAADAGKRVLLAGERATVANVTTFGRGVNRLIVDVAGLAPDAAPTPADFGLAVMSASAPGTWSPGATPPAVAVARGAGLGGSDRITLTFPPGAYRNTWLRVTVAANDRTRLNAPDVFYIGNLVGDAGGVGTPRVDGRDLAMTRAAIGKTTVGVLEKFDFNRDGAINAIDLAAVRNNLRRSLPLFTAPAAAAAAASAAGDAPVPAGSPRGGARPLRRDLLGESPADLLA